MTATAEQLERAKRYMDGLPACAQRTPFRIVCLGNQISNKSVCTSCGLVIERKVFNQAPTVCPNCGAGSENDIHSSMACWTKEQQERFFKRSLPEDCEA